MASSGFNDCNSKLSDISDKSKSKIHSNEHEETIKSDQMATKEFDEKPHIEDLDERQLKLLLDEAMDYKNPRDVNDKSDTFKQLLKNVTEEDNKLNESYFGPFGLKQSNSLQNILDDSHYQLSSHQSHTSGKKHHQQRRKNSTSVSARRLEGGSLPIDMHHSSAVQSPPDQPFLSEYKNKKRKEKQQKEIMIGCGEDDTAQKKQMQRHFDGPKDGISSSSSSSYPHDGIEMKHVYTSKVEMEIPIDNYPSAHTITTISSITASGGLPLSTASIINSKVTSQALLNNSESVDKAIEYTQIMEQPSSYQQKQQLTDGYGYGSRINPNNHIVLTNPDHSFSNVGKMDAANLPLNPSYNAVTCLTSNDKSTSKVYVNKLPNHDNNASVPQLIQTNQQINTPAHQSSAVINSKEGKSKQKRTSKSERNEKVIDVTTFQGFRGMDELDDLIKYIDGDKKNQKNHQKNGIVSSNQTSDHLLSAEEKKRKMTAKNKEKVNKLKKSNSMDELCSTGRQEQQQQEKSTSAANKIIQDVTLRSKSNLTSGAKKGDKSGGDKSQQKRNERRSWGTEGLWTEASDPQKDNQDETQEVESSSSSTSNGPPSEIMTEPLTPVNSIESAATIVNEEFHVVTKKRKVKRKSSDGGELGKATNNLHGYNHKRDGNVRPGARAYNDREVSLKNARTSKPSHTDGKPSAGKNRRKSTSSMPPSDDDWHSDGGDSVQSLPIETTKTTSSQLLSTTVVANETTSSGGKGKKNSNQSHHQQQQQQQKPATFSYADIAKTNASRNNGTNVTTSTDKWPSITASSSSTTTTNNNNASHQNNIDPFSIANFDAISNPPSNPKAQQQQHQQKPAPITSSMSFPELVETNNNKNKQLSSHTPSLSENGDTINNTTEKPMNGLDANRAFDTNNNNNNNNNSNEDRLNNNQKISYSQSLLESHNNNQELDTNGNNVKDSNALPITNATKLVLTKSKSVDHNNLSSIEHYPALEKTQATLGEVFSKPPVTFETYASKSKQKQMKPDLKLTKKDKLKKSTSVQNAQYSAQQNVIGNCRPAVIILNDSAKSSDVDCGITFGFDINEHLLFGQNGEDEGGEACVMDVSLETNNNNNKCDITNTNLSSNNNLTNQPCGVGAEVYENFSMPQNIIVGENHVTLNQLSPPQQQNNALDSSNHSSNDMGYLSSSLITNSTSPATLKSTSSMPNDDHIDSMPDDGGETQRQLLEVKRIVNIEDCKLVLPLFVPPGPFKFNHDELVQFVSDEWTKVIRNATYFIGQ